MFVLIIIAILAILALPRFIKATETVKGREAITSLEQIKAGEIVYRSDENTYWPLGAVAESDVVIINSQLKLFLDTRELNWDYSVVAPTASTFTATATRTSGRNDGETITLNQAGTIDYGGWIP